MKLKNIEIIAVVIIFVFSFFVRINNFIYPYFDQDLNRDYLVASHIINYGEVPLNGPGGQVSNSPFYYYFLAGLLMINDSIVFLSFINIVLQLANLLYIYFLAKNMFGRNTAIISLLLFSSSQFAIVQAEKMWQPNLMLPFINLSFLLLLYAYLKKSRRFLVSSIVVFVVAGTLHNPAFAITPTFIFAVMLILKNKKATKINYLEAAATFILSFLILYTPLLYYLGGLSSKPSLFSEVLHKFVYPFSLEFVGNLFDRTKLLFSTVFIRGETSYLLIMLFLVSIYYYSLKKINKVYFSILILGILQFLIVASFLKIGSSFPFPDRYLTPILSLLIISISEVCNRVFSGRVFLHILKIGVVAVLFYQTTYAYDMKSSQYLLANSLLNIGDRSTYSPNRRAMEENIVAWIENEIRQIQKDKYEDDINFFQFKSYLFGYEYLYLEAPFYVFLEKDFNKKFTEVSNSDSRGFTPLMRDDYLFFICRLTPEQLGYENCADTFLRAYSNYKIIKTMTSEPPYIVNIAEKLE